MDGPSGDRPTASASSRRRGRAARARRRSEPRGAPRARPPRARELALRVARPASSPATPASRSTGSSARRRRAGRRRAPPPAAARRPGGRPRLRQGEPEDRDRSRADPRRSPQRRHRRRPRRRALRPRRNGSRCSEAAHPLPDERSIAAARAPARAGRRGRCRRHRDRLLHGRQLGVDEPAARRASRTRRSATSTGSCSAPGLPISEVNMVRKQVSGFKGGRLALAVAAGAPDQPDGLRRRRRPARRDHRSDRRQRLDRRRRDRDPAQPRPLGRCRRQRSAHHLRGPAARRSPTFRTSRSTPPSWSPARPPARRWPPRRDRAGANPVILSTGLEEEASAVGRILGQLAFESAELRRPFAASRGPDRLRRREHRPARQPSTSFGDGRPEPGGRARRRAGRIEGADVCGGLHRHRRLRRRHRPRRRDQRRRDRRPGREAGIDLRDALARHRSGAAVAALGDGDRHRTDPHQRQRPVRDRDRRGARMSATADEGPMIVLERVCKRFGEATRRRRRLARDRPRASSSRCSARAAAGRRRRCG